MEVAPKTKRIRGFVEARGPDRISGWAWRSGERPLTVMFSLDGEPVGECRADGLRPDLAKIGYGDGRVAFSWNIPDRNPPIDPAAVRVSEASTETALPDAPGLEPVRRAGHGIKGYVEARGPEVISGWAWTADGPLSVVFVHEGKVIGFCCEHCLADFAADPAKYADKLK